MKAFWASICVLIVSVASSAAGQGLRPARAEEVWGQRTAGSIAGWGGGVHPGSTGLTKLLVKTPLENLLLTGIYAATELFFGGVSTALYTGRLAADVIGGAGRP